MSASAVAIPLALLAACGRPETGLSDQFGQTGELVALSGAGAGAANACFTCHGIEGGGDGAGVPRLAGLDPGYLQHQLEAYADGRRQNPSMHWIARKLDPEERVRVALYYSRLQPAEEDRPGNPQPPEIYIAGAPERNIPPCASCHGPDALGTGQAIPPLAAQPKAYLVQQIESWRRGKRRSDPDDVMLEIARSITPAEAEAVAAYAAALPAASRRGSAEGSLSGRRYGPRNDASALPRRVSEP